MNIDLYQTATGLLEKIQKKEISALELLEIHLRKIEASNQEIKSGYLLLLYFLKQASGGLIQIDVVVKPFFDKKYDQEIYLIVKLSRSSVNESQSYLFFQLN